MDTLKGFLSLRIGFSKIFTEKVMRKVNMIKLISFAVIAYLNLSFLLFSSVKLRSYSQELTREDAAAIIKKYNFQHYDKNPNGDFLNDFEPKVINGDKVVIDKNTNLMWGLFDFGRSMYFNSTYDAITILNKKSYAGYNNWRLPTLEEALTILENNPNQLGFYINPLFNNKQTIWTCDSFRLSYMPELEHFYVGIVDRMYGMDPDKMPNSIQLVRSIINNSNDAVNRIYSIHLKGGIINLKFDETNYENNIQLNNKGIFKFSCLYQDKEHNYIDKIVSSNADYDIVLVKNYESGGSAREGENIYLAIIVYKNGEYKISEKVSETKIKGSPKNISYNNGKLSINNIKIELEENQKKIIPIEKHSLSTKNEKDDFMNFFKKFMSDRTFSINRVKFPLAHYPKSTKSNWNWRYAELTKKKQGDIWNDPKINGDDATVIYQSEGTGICVVYSFKLIKDWLNRLFWYLVDIEDVSM